MLSNHEKKIKKHRLFFSQKSLRGSHPLVVITLDFVWLICSPRLKDDAILFTLMSCFFSRTRIFIWFFRWDRGGVTFIWVGWLSAMAAEDEFEPFNVATQCGSRCLAEIPRVGRWILLDSVRNDEMSAEEMKQNKKQLMNVSADLSQGGPLTIINSYI